MTQAQSLEMVFSTNGPDTEGDPADLDATLKAAQRDLALQKKTTQAPYDQILDRLEQLEFALAEAILRGDPDPSELAPASAITALSERIDGLSQQISRQGDTAAARAADMPVEQISRILDRLDGAATARAEETAILVQHLENLETRVEARIAPIETALKTLAEAVQQDRQASSASLSMMAETFEPLTGFAARLRESGADVNELKSGQDRLTIQMETLTAMMTTLANEVKHGQAVVPDLAALRDPLMDRMDRLDTTAEQRQRELSAEMADIAERPLPETDLTPVRETFARLMVAMQALHKGQETSGVEIQDKIAAVQAEIEALPERVKTGADQRQKALLKEIETIADRPVPAPDLAPVRDTMARFMVSLQSMDQNRSDIEQDMITRISALADQVSAISETAFPNQIDAVDKMLEPLRQTLEDASASVQAAVDQPKPVLDGATVREALSDQLGAIIDWMNHHDQVQSTISGLLDTLSQSGAQSEDGQGGLDDLREALTSNHLSARQQLEDLEVRLSTQLTMVTAEMNDRDLAQGSANHQPGGLESPVAHDQAQPLHDDDQRLLEAVTSLRAFLDDVDGSPDTKQLEDRRQELRIALAEILATMQAGSAVDI